MLSDMVGKTVAFAASGGLDSCTITKWLSENGVRVVCFTADIAQPDEQDFDDIRTRMLACGAADFVRIPLHDEIASAGVSAVQALARYEGGYWNTTGIGREVLIRGMVKEVIARDIPVISHGATGRGNDHLRFQVMTHMLAPDLEVYAPWRDPAFLSAFRGRQEMIAFCEDRRLPIKASASTPYSTDANLLGLTHEAGQLESLMTPASIVDPKLGAGLSAVPDATTVEIRFLRGHPVEINGKRTSDLDALKLLNALGEVHGIGLRVHVVENRTVGLKSRGVYGAPGMEVLATAYEFLLQLILDGRARRHFDELSRLIAIQTYQGYGFDLCSQMARAGISSVSALATGVIEVVLTNGHAYFASAHDVPHSLYSETNTSMEAVGEFDHADAEGMAKILSISARTTARAGQVE